jgi:hypothetical protein
MESTAHPYVAYSTRHWTELKVNCSKFTYCKKVSVILYGVDWIHLDPDRVQQEAPVNTVISLRVIQKARNFLTT